MTHIHHQEKEQFKKLFSDENIDNFEDRFNILEVFLKTEHHVTENELVELIHQKGYRVDPALVKDTLKLMFHYGFAQARRFDNGVVRYEHRHLAQHHDHIICLKCRKITEFKDDQLENLQIKIAVEHGFHILQHKMEMYGICADCLKQRVRLMPLIEAKVGERLIIKEFTGGAASRLRLMTMGLRVGDEVEIISNFDKGQVVLAIDFNRYALGRGLAQKILVQPLKP